VLSTGANRALLDNFSIDELRTAYELKLASDNLNILLEASGNITNKNIRGIAETGIDFVSVGALTKNIEAIDLTLLINSI
jgi:nicotinate-nucleotide pyrophosphorylase (carboxylating)